MRRLFYIVKTTEPEAKGLQRWLQDNNGSLDHRTHLPDPRRAHPVVSRISIPDTTKDAFEQIAIRAQWLIRVVE